SSSAFLIAQFFRVTSLGRLSGVRFVSIVFPVIGSFQRANQVFLPLAHVRERSTTPGCGLVPFARRPFRLATTSPPHAPPHSPACKCIRVSPRRAAGRP